MKKQDDFLLNNIISYDFYSIPYRYIFSYLCYLLFYNDILMILKSDNKLQKQFQKSLLQYPDFSLYAIIKNLYLMIRRIQERQKIEMKYVDVVKKYPNEPRYHTLSNHLFCFNFFGG